jgi:hypothetical protein
MSSASSDGGSTLAIIQRELAALQEAKSMNEAALKGALLRKQQKKAEGLVAAAGGGPSSKSAIRGVGGPPPLTGTAKLAWEAAIIEEELSRPLEVSEEFIRDLNAKEAETEARLLSGLAKHAESLHALRTKLIDRELAAEKTYAVRAAKDALGPRPVTLDDYAAALQGGGSVVDGSGGSSVGGARRSPSRLSTRSAAHTALTAFTAAESHVLESLSRLEDLESRIAELESRAGGADLAELLGISMPPDAGTGSSSADVLRSAYAPMKPMGSASTRGRRSVSPTNMGKSVFSTASRGTGAGSASLPQVGFAPALGVVYTRKRMPSQNGIPGKVVYTVERLEDATERRGLGLGAAAGLGGSSMGGGYTYDADTDPSAPLHGAAAAYGATPVRGDTGGSASGRNSAGLQGSPDGDDDGLYGGGGGGGGGGGVIPPLPIETSDAIDRWLAAKQRQIANQVQAKEAEGLIKSSFIEAKKKAVVGGGAAGAAAGARGRGRAAPGAAPNTLAATAQPRLAQSVGPTVGAARGRPPVARAGLPALPAVAGTGAGAAAGTPFQRRAAKTVPVGNNISRVLAAEKARLAAKQARAGAPVPAKPLPAGAAAAARSSARVAANRATLNEFQSMRKKFDAQKTAVRGAVAGGAGAGAAGGAGAARGRGATGATPGGGRVPAASPTRGRTGGAPTPGQVRSTSNPRGAAAGNAMRSPAGAAGTRSTSNPAGARRGPGGGAAGGPGGVGAGGGIGGRPGGGPPQAGRLGAASPVRGRQGGPAAAPAPRLGVLGASARGPGAGGAAGAGGVGGGGGGRGAVPPVNAVLASISQPSYKEPQRMPPVATGNRPPGLTGNPLGGRAAQQARQKFGQGGVKMETLAGRGR